MKHVTSSPSEIAQHDEEARDTLAAHDYLARSLDETSAVARQRRVFREE